MQNQILGQIQSSCTLILTFSTLFDRNSGCDHSIVSAGMDVPGAVRHITGQHFCLHSQTRFSWLSCLDRRLSFPAQGARPGADHQEAAPQRGSGRDGGDAAAAVLGRHTPGPEGRVSGFMRGQGRSSAVSYVVVGGLSAPSLIYWRPGVYVPHQV